MDSSIDYLRHEHIELRELKRILISNQILIAFVNHFLVNVSNLLMRFRNDYLIILNINSEYIKMYIYYLTDRLKCRIFSIPYTTIVPFLNMNS